MHHLTWCFFLRSHFLTERNPAFRTAPVQLNEADEAAAMEDAAEPGALLLRDDPINRSHMDNTQTKVK